MLTSHTKLFKFAAIYKLATLFAFGATAQEAIRELVELVDHNDLIPVGTNFQAIKTPGVSDTEKINSLHSLKELIEEIKQKYSASEDFEDIEFALAVIYDDAASGLSHLAFDEAPPQEYGDEFNDQVSSVTHDVGVQDGESEAKAGGYSITEDMGQKLERQKQYDAQRRQSPVTRQQVLDYHKQYQKNLAEQKPEYVAGLKKASRLKAKTIEYLMRSGLSKEQAEQKFEQIRMSLLADKLKALKERGEVSSEEAKSRISDLKSESTGKLKDFSKYYNSQLTSQKNMETAPTPVARRMIKSRSRDATRRLYIKESIRSGVPEYEAQANAAQLSLDEIDALHEKYMQEAQKLVA